MQAHSPKNGPASQRKPKERLKRCRDAGAALQQAWLPQAMQRHVYHQRSVQDPGRNPRHPQTSKLTYFRTLQSSYTRKGRKTFFASGTVDSWGAGPRLRAHIHTHHAEATLN